MKPLIIYHANCTDGFGAAYAAWLRFGDDADYLPVKYGQVNTVDDLDLLGNLDREVYILDFCFESIEIMEEIARRSYFTVCLDHHKTTFERYMPDVEFTENALFEYVAEDLNVIFNNQESGAMLAWNFFFPDHDVPSLICWIDDRDRWQFKLAGTKKIHAFMASIKPWSFEQWQRVQEGDEGFWNGALLAGEAILKAHDANVKEVVEKAMKCTIWKHCGDIYDERNEIEVNGLVTNCPASLSSDAGHALANKSGTYGLLWQLKNRERVTCSLRSNGDYDVSRIAKAFGGGGHKNAAGFETSLINLLNWIGE